MFCHSLDKLGWSYSTVKCTANFAHIEVSNTKWSYRMDGSYRQTSHSPFCERSEEQLLKECRQLWHPLLRKVTLELHQVLRLPRKVTLELHQVLHLPRKVTLELHQVLRPPRKVTLELHQVLRLPRKVPLDLHQVLRLPRKVTLDLHQLLRLPHRMTRRLDPRHIWNVISNARSNKCHPPNSPHTAPATQNDHPTSGRNLRKTAETSFPMRGRSEHDPITFRDRSETVSVSPQPATQQRLLFALRTNGLYWKRQHFALRLSFQISPSTAPATKSDTWTSPSTAPTTKSDTWTSPSTAPTTQSDTWTSPSTAPTTQSDTWTSPSTAPATKSDTWPSPSTAPATQNDSQAWSSSHMKRHFQCEEQQMSPSKLTTYCACHAKWPSNIWQKFAENSWNVISNARPIRTWSDHVPRPFRDRFRQSATRHATEVTFRAPDEGFVLKNTTFRAPAIFPNFTKYCAYHEKWHFNFTKYCAYHAKWHLNFTKYCAYHAKWHLTFTNYCAYHAKWHLKLNQVLRLPRKVTLDLSDLLRSDSTQRFFDSTITQRSITQRFYKLTLLLRSDSNWLYSYAAILIDSTLTQRF